MQAYLIETNAFVEGGTDSLNVTWKSVYRNCDNRDEAIDCSVLYIRAMVRTLVGAYKIDSDCVDRMTITYNCEALLND